MKERNLIETMQRIGQLLFKRLNNKLTVEEEIELDDWIAQQHLINREFFDHILEPDQIDLALAEMDAFDTPSAFLEVQQTILNAPSKYYPEDTPVWLVDMLEKGPPDDAPITPESTTTPQPETQTHAEIQTQPEIYPQPEPPPHKIRKIARWIAAAIIGTLVISMGILTYIKLTHDGPIIPEPISWRYHNDVAPGGDKATLRLADGSLIQLDSAANGTLASLGNTRVIKLKNGLLNVAAIHQKPGQTTTTQYNTISTPKGGQYKITLVDGSTVWLNAGSALRFPTAFSSIERKVELSGEAYFEVAKDADKPFKVVINAPAGNSISQEISVLGTDFNVMAYPDQGSQKTTLIEGSIRVSNGKEEKQLQPGQQASLSIQNGLPYMILVDHANTEEILAWTNGLFQFHDASIRAIMQQISRWYDIDITYKGEVQQEFIGTIPRDVSLATILRILESTGWVHFTIDGKKITVMP